MCVIIFIECIPVLKNFKEQKITKIIQKYLLLFFFYDGCISEMQKNPII